MSRGVLVRTISRMAEILAVLRGVSIREDGGVSRVVGGGEFEVVLGEARVGVCCGESGKRRGCSRMF